MADLQLVVQMLADTRQLNKTTKGIESQMQGLKRSVLGLGAGLGLAFGAQQAVQAIGSAIGKANDLEEAQSRVAVIFGESTAVVTHWADTTAQAYRLSDLEAQKALGDIGALLKGAGLEGEELAAQTTLVAEAVGDIASFNNLSSMEALEKVMAGISGEAEPLRRLGYDMRQAAVDSKAAEAGLDDTADVIKRIHALTDQGGVLGVTGDSIRTNDTAIGQAEQLRVEMENMETEIGEKLIPLQRLWNQTLLTTLGLVNAVGEELGEWGDAATGGNGAFQTLAEGFEEFVTEADLALLQMMHGEEAGRRYAQAIEQAAGIVARAWDAMPKGIKNATISVEEAMAEQTIAAEAEAKKLSQVVSQMIGSGGDIPTQFDTFYKEHREKLANARWFLDPANVAKELKRVEKYMRKWRRIEAKAHAEGNTAMAKYAQDQLAILAGLREDLGGDADDMWATFTKKQKKALRAAITSMTTLAKRLWAALLAVFNQQPASPGYQAWLDRTSPPDGRSVTVNNTTTINTSGTAQDIAGVVQSTMRRAQPALVRGF